MCGKPTSGAILCPNCDRPRKSGSSRTAASGSKNSQAAPALDPFPEAPVVQFPVESTSPAITTIREILTAARVPSLLLGTDGKVRFISSDARTLLGFENESAPLTSVMIEARIGMRLPKDTEPQTQVIEIGGKPVVFSAIPLSGGASGTAVILRPKVGSVPSSYMNFVRETILTPLLGLREALLAAARNRGADPLLRDSASTIDQVLSSLELAPEIEESELRDGLPVRPSVAAVVQSLSERFRPLVHDRQIQLQMDFPDASVPFRDLSDLEDVLGILIENSLRYVPTGGQIVIGLRRMEHKGSPLLLFFVMDTGPVVPPELREQIFAKDFVWNPKSSHRTGRGLARCRQFATAHGGSIWVESKTGKACTFFLRVRPDS